MRSNLSCILSLLIILSLSVTAQQPKNSYYGDKKIQVLELRNYVIKEGGRDKFIDSFKVYIEDSQNAKGAYVLGLYRVKGADNNFYWLRGYENMPLRKKAMEDFYSSAYWATIVRMPQEFVINFHNVHLLKPYDMNTGDSISGFSASWFDQPKGVAVIDYYTGNERRNEVIDYFKKTYQPMLINAGAKNIAYWIAEDQPNNYPRHPVFRDMNTLVSISFYENEKAYNAVMKKLAAQMNADKRNEMRKVFTLHRTEILYNAK